MVIFSTIEGCKEIRSHLPNWMSALSPHHQDITEIRLDASPPLLALPGPRMKRNPSLSKVSAWTGEDVRYAREDIKEAERGNRTPLLEDPEEKTNKQWNHLQDYSLWEQGVICFRKYERKATNLLVKLLLHLTLLSAFESLFYFFYVSSLEDGGIKKTINVFINSAVQRCQNMTIAEIQLINDFVDPLVNTTYIIAEGNTSELVRRHINEKLMDLSWEYAGGLMGVFTALTLYALVRRLDVDWKHAILDNVATLSLLAGYEVLFFNQIIYKYQPLTTHEISRDAVERLQGACGLFQASAT